MWYRAVGLPTKEMLDGGRIPFLKQKVVCVDDDPELARMIKATLERAGYQVTHVTSAPDALDSFKEASDPFDFFR